MAKYSEWVTYFRGISVENNTVKHNFQGNKKFFRMNIEELFAGMSSQLPSSAEGPFFVFINYISDLTQTGSAISNKQMMFMILQGCSTDDYDGEETAMNTCEEVAHEYVRRMKHDSQNGEDPFEYGFDVIKAKIVATKVHGSTCVYVGWQVSFEPTNSFNDCYDASKFTTAAP